MRSGNVERARQICRLEHQKRGEGLRRRHVMHRARDEAIPEPTMTKVWQQYRLDNNLP